MSEAIVHTRPKKRSRFFQFRLVTLFRLMTFVAMLLGGWQGLHLWNKWDFCSGWGKHYAGEADRYRQMAKEPNLTEADVAAYYQCAREYDVVSSLYLKVARRPWLPYPWKTKEWQQIRLTAQQQ